MNITSGAIGLTNVTIDGDGGTLNYGVNHSAISITTPTVMKNIAITGTVVNDYPLYITGGSVTFQNCNVSGFTNNRSSVFTTQSVCGGVICSTVPVVIDSCNFLNIIAITNNTHSTSGNNLDSCGGVAYTSNDLIVINTTIQGCTSTYGGALYGLSSATKTITNCIFNNNYAAYRGGAIYDNSATSEWIIEGSTFSNNRSVNSSGAIFLRKFTITNSLITGNTSGYDCSAIFLNNQTSSISGSTICRNTTAGAGGVYVNGGILTISNTDFSNNNGAAAVALYVGSGTVTCTECTFTYNYSTGQDPIKVAGSGKGIFNNCIIEGNTATHHAGGYANGGGTIEMNSCIIRNNIARSGDVAGVCAHSNHASVTLTGCTVANNTNIGSYCGGLHAAQASTVTCLDCLVSGNTAKTYGGGLEMNWADGVMSLTRCIVVDNVAENGTGHGGDFRGTNTTLYMTDCTFGLNQSISIGTTAANNCAIYLYGHNKLQDKLNGPYASITIDAGAILDLWRNPVANAIVGGTITAQGALSILDTYGNRHDYLARSVTGSTITNMGQWLPYPGRLVISTAGNYSVGGYTIDGQPQQSYGSNAYITAGTVSIFDMIFKNSPYTSNTNWGGGLNITGTSIIASVTGCTFSDNKAQCGAGLFINNTSVNIEVSKCLFTNNYARYAGAAIQVYNHGQVLISDCDITGNTATGNRSVVFINGTGTATVRNCRFYGNIGTQPIALSVETGYLTVSGCSFGADQNIKATYAGGYITFSETNTILSICQSPNTNLTIEANSIFDLRNNQNTNVITGTTITALGPFTVIDKDGYYHSYPAKYLTGSTITNTGLWLPNPVATNRLVLSTSGSSNSYNNIIISNKSITNTAGSAVLVSNGATASISGSTISNNNDLNVTATNNTGACAVQNSGSKLTIVNSLITGNTSGSGGGLLATDSGTLEVIGCTITNNITSGSVYGGAVRASATSKSTFTNCLITGNSTGVSGGAFVIVDSSTVTLTGCTITGNSCGSGGYTGCDVERSSATLIIDGGVYNDSTYLYSTAKMTLKGNIVLTSFIYSQGCTVTVATGTTINIRGNSNTNVIYGGSIVLQGSLTVIDKDGLPHTYSAQTKTKLTNDGILS